MSLADRVLTRVHQDGECWAWDGALSYAGGYGHVRVVVDGEGRDFLTHRVVYEAMVGPIPDGHQIDHLCRNRVCCNPDHLEAVTPKVNVLRSEAPAAARAAQTHCVNGHEFTVGNTAIRPNGTRKCRRCDADRQQRRRDNRQAPTGGT